MNFVFRGYLFVCLCYPILGTAQGIQKHSSSGITFFVGGTKPVQAATPVLLFTPPPLGALTTAVVKDELTSRFATEKYDPLLRAAAERYSLPFALVKAVALVESHLNPLAVSHKGAQGIMQLMPQTAQSLQVNDPFDPIQNIDGGARLLRRLLDQYDGELTLALAAYNAGEGAVTKYGNVIPPYRETQDYVRRVQGHIEQIGDQGRPQEQGPVIK